MPTLYDPTGKPLAPSNRLRAVDKDVIIGLRRPRFSPVIARGLTPERLRAIFDDMDRGKLDDFLTLAKELEQRDAHYRSVMGVRKLSALKRPVVVTPASEDSRDLFIADELESLVKSPAWLWMSLHCLDALGKGYAVVELVWDFSEGRAHPTFKQRDPRDFTLDRESLTYVRRKIPGTTNLEVLPYGKYVVHSPSLVYGSPVDGALARTASILYLYSALAIQDLGDFIERFGTPALLGEYVSAEHKQDLLDGLEALARAGYGVVPPGTKVEKLDAGRLGGGEKIHDMAIRMFDELKSKLVLGQTMTSDNGSSRSQAEVHDQVKDDVTDFDCWCLSTTQMEHVVSTWTRLNFGEGVTPPNLSRPGDDEEDVQEIANVLFGMVDRGAKVPVRHIRDLLGVPEPGEADEVLEPASTGAGDIPGSPNRGEPAEVEASSPVQDQA